VGQRVRVRMQEPIAGRRQFRGVLVDASEQSISVHDPDVGAVSLALDGIERASTEFEFPSPAAKGPRSSGSTRGPRQAHA